MSPKLDCQKPRHCLSEYFFVESSLFTKIMSQNHPKIGGGRAEYWLCRRRGATRTRSSRWWMAWTRVSRLRPARTILNRRRPSRTNSNRWRPVAGRRSGQGWTGSDRPGQGWRLIRRRMGWTRLSRWRPARKRSSRRRLTRIRLSRRRPGQGFFYDFTCKCVTRSHYLYSKKQKLLVNL